MDDIIGCFAVASVCTPDKLLAMSSKLTLARGKAVLAHSVVHDAQVGEDELNQLNEMCKVIELY